MTERGSEAARLYLRDLDAALRTVPEETAREVREGIAEELYALDPRDLPMRIASLGDPLHIAAEARRAGGVGGAIEETRPHGHTTPTPRMTDSRPFVVAAALLVGFGSWALPGLGWIAGIVMTWWSPVWRRGEKVIATIAPAAVGVAFALIIALAAGTTGGAVEVPVNPLVPEPSLIVWNAAIIALLTAMPIGVWLLLVGVRRTRHTLG